MGGLRDGKSPAAFAAYGRQGPRTVSESKSRKAAHLSVERRAIRVHGAVFSVIQPSNCSPHPETVAPRRSWLAHGISVELMVELVRAGLATAKAERVVAGGKSIEVARVRITEAGRRALSQSE